MEQGKRPTKAFRLAIIAGFLIVINSTLVGIAAAWFPAVFPTLPGSTSTDQSVLFRLTAVGLASGVLVLLGGMLLHYKPSHMRAWGVMIIVFSLTSLVTAGGFIIGFILGIIGGAFALSGKKKVQAS
jgi:hypothetical protein